MKKSKRRSETLGEEEDRLSELPDSVIFHIFWFVPMSDVVRTTILSKRWRNLWTTIPFLNFDDDSLTLDGCDPHKFCSFVKQLLFRWNGVRLLKFRVCYCFDCLIYSEIELWVEFAIAKGVEELYLNNTLYEYMAYDESEEESCWVPQSVYSCSSLKALSIGACKLRIYEYVQWNQLKNLTITEGFEVTELVISQILYGSPRLEVFNLSFVDKGQNLNIRSKSLKELSICKHLFVPQDLSLTSELTIWTPNLETLKIEGVPFGIYRSIDVSSSTHVSIGFCGSIYHGGDDCQFSGINLGNCLSFHDFLVKKFYRILSKMHYVGSVTLSCCCLEVLGFMEKMRFTFREVKSLKIKYHFNDYEQLLGLNVFPKLNRLLLQDNQHHYNQNEPVEFEAKSHFKFVFFPHQLRIVDITWSEGEGIFPFLEFLLRYAGKLENMVLRVKEVKPGSAPTDSLLVASQKLLKMPRSSTNCTVHIIPYVQW